MENKSPGVVVLTKFCESNSKQFAEYITYILVLTFVFMISLTIPVNAAGLMVPTYEVKYLLDSSMVLNRDHQLKKTYRNLFETGDSYKTVGVLYLDTKNQAFYNEGWVNRIRIKENKNKFELTYKKRYGIVGGDIDAAIILAKQEGFDSSDTNYEAEVDWGYSKMTLSISNKKKKSNKGYKDMELPKKEEAIQILKDKMPGKEKDWISDKWGMDLIKYAKKAGPVYYTKYKGEVEGADVAIEVWPIENQDTGEIEYITELSFKEDTYSTASNMRESLMQYLDTKEILLHQDALKTRKVLDAYLGN